MFVHYVYCWIVSDIYGVNDAFDLAEWMFSPVF